MTNDELERYDDLDTHCQRQDFEEWAAGKGWNVERYKKGYNNIGLNLIWQGCIFWPIVNTHSGGT